MEHNMPSQEEFQAAYDETDAVIKHMLYLDECRLDEEHRLEVVSFYVPLSDETKFEILVPKKNIYMRTIDTTLKVVEGELARTHVSAVCYLDTWGATYIEVARRLCKKRILMAWEALQNIAQNGPELEWLRPLSPPTFFQDCKNDHDRWGTEALVVEQWDRVIAAIADVPFLDEHCLRASVMHELVAAGWDRESLPDPFKGFMHQRWSFEVKFKDECKKKSLLYQAKEMRKSYMAEFPDDPNVVKNSLLAKHFSDARRQATIQGW